MLTNEQFAASMHAHVDLRTCGQDNVEAFFSDRAEPCPGLVYEAGLYIEDWAAQNLIEGRYYLQIANTEWISDDLAFLESQLYAFYASEHAEG